jgi:hypothetical protein
MKLLSMHFPPLSCHIISLRFKYFLLRPITQTHLYLVYLYVDRSKFAHTKQQVRFQFCTEHLRCERIVY